MTREEIASALSMPSLLPPKPARKIRLAAECHSDRRHVAKGLCRGCYDLARRAAQYVPEPGVTVPAASAIWMYGNLRASRRFHLIRGRVAKTFGSVLAGACGVTLTRPALSVEPPADLLLCDLCALADYESPAVYRLYDAYGQPLYIGCTTALFQRLMSHVSGQFWALVARIDFTQHTTIEEALVAEFQEIAAAQPPYNKRHTARDRRPWRCAARRPPGNRTRFLPSATTPAVRDE
jgi:hypothetical protein